MVLKKHLAQKPKRDVDLLPLGKPNRTNAFALARVPQQQSKLIKLSCFHVRLSPSFDVLLSILA